MKYMVNIVVMVIFGIFLVACGDDKKDNTESSNVESTTQSSVDSNTESNTNTESNVESNTESNAESSTNTESKAESTTESKQVSSVNPQDLYKKCIACHGAKGDKIAPGSVGNVLISTLSKDEIVENLRGYRARTLSKGGTAAVMYLQAKNLSDSDIELLGEYISNFN